MPRNASIADQGELEAERDDLQQSAALQRAGKSDLAVAVLRKAIRHSADDWRLHHALGEALIAAGRDEEAIGLFMTAFRLNPGLGSACVSIGRIFLSGGLALPAATWLRRALDIEADNADCIPALAVAEVQLGQQKQAAALLDSWIAADPADPIRRHIAVAILGETTPSKAEEAYVSRLFDNYAERFDDSLKRLCYCGPQLIAEALARCGPDPWPRWDMLDVGCGTGLVGVALRPLARHLVGVDLSKNMLRLASDRGLYDELCKAEMNVLMRSRERHFDAVTAADVLTYSGDLREFCASAQATLRPGGLLIALFEALEDDSVSAGYRLNPTGRFSHSEQYVHRCLLGHGFVIRAVSHTPMRIDYGHPTPTLIVAAQRADSS